MKLSVISLAVLLVLTVDYVGSQTTGGFYAFGMMTYGGQGTTTAIQTTTGPAGEVEYELEEIITTTTPKPTPKPKPKRFRKRKGKGRKKGRPKNLKPSPGKKPGSKRGPPKSKPMKKKPTTPPPTPAPTPAPTTRPPTIRTTLAPTTLAPTRPPTRPPTQPPIVAAASGYQGGGAQAVDVRVVPQGGGRGTSPAPTTKARARYLYEPHSCPKMHVATWENEVVIYDNKNCAIIVRMNLRLKRPTVTFQAPYW